MKQNEKLVVVIDDFCDLWVDNLTLKVTLHLQNDGLKTSLFFGMA